MSSTRGERSGVRSARGERAPGGNGTEGSGDKVKVLYVAGWGRSGSTLLGRILGQVKDFCLVGELRYVWDRGLIENRLCSCGAPFRECPFWRKVLYEAFGAVDSVRAERLVSMREQGIRTRHVLLAAGRKSLQARVFRMTEYLHALDRLYRAARAVSHSTVVVDTSKFPGYGYTLQSMPGIDLYVLHLVRDPRAVAYSWGVRKKPRLDRSGGPSGLMTPHGFIESSLVWDEWNLAIERVRREDSGHYMLLRYEDFVESPRTSVESIMRFLGEKGAELPFQDERNVSLKMPHTFSGNPDRFSNGHVTVRSDEGWKRAMSMSQQALVTALTWPGLIRYRYPLLPQRDSSPHRQVAVSP